MSQGMRKSGKPARRLAITFGLIGAVLALPTVAEAQWYGYRHPYFSPHNLQPLDDELSPRELIQAARSQGFHRPSRPVYHDEVAVLNAVAPNGQPVRISLDIYSGHILNVSPLARRQVARVRPELREEEPPRRRRPQVVERSPEMRPQVRRPAEAAKPGGATPEKPTIVRRAPLLPPQPGKPPSVDQPPRSSDQPVTSQVPTNPGGVGSGTRGAPRRIEIAPPAKSDVPTPPI